MVASSGGPPPQIASEDMVLNTTCGRATPSMVLAVAWVGYFCVYIGRKPLAVCKKSLEEKEGFSTSALGALDTGFLACYAMGSFCGGAIGDKYGERITLSTVIGGAAIACMLFACSNNMALMALAWALNGLMQGVPYPCYMKLLATSFGSRLGSAAGVWQTSAYVGGGLGNFIAGSLVAKYDWPAAFLTPAVVLAMMSALTYLLTPFSNSSAGEAPKTPTKKDLSSPRLASKESQEMEAIATRTDEGNVRQRGEDVHRSESASKVEGAGRRSKAVACVRTARDICRIPSLASVSAAYFLVKLARYAMLFWLPFFLVKERKYSESAAGTIASCFELGGLVGCPLAGFVTDTFARGHRFRVVMPFLCVCACFFLVYADGVAYVQDPPITAIPLAGAQELPGESGASKNWLAVAFDVIVLSCIGVFISGPDSIFAGPAAQDIGKNSGGVVGPATVVGMVDGLGSLGSVLQGAVTAAVTTGLGWPALFRLCAGLMLTACMLTLHPSRLEAKRLDAKLPM